MEERVKAIECLARSPARVRMLLELQRQNRLDKAELKDRVDVSRTSVERNLTTLKNQGWIENTYREYQITLKGELVAEKFAELLDTVQLAEKLEPILKWMPQSEFDINPLLLMDADVVVADPADPYAPVNRHIDAMNAAEEFRCLLPAIGFQAMRIAHDCVIDQGNRHEIVVSADVADTLQTEPAYSHLFNEMLQTGRLSAYVTDEELPFYMGLGNGLIQVGVEDDDGIPRALLESDAEEVRTWAEQKYNWYKNHATSFT